MVEENDLSFHLRWLPPKPEPLAESWGGKGPRECHSTPSELQRGREGREEKEAEGERAGREESRVKFSSSPFLVVRPAGSQGKFSPFTSPLLIMDLTSSGSSAGCRPPTDRHSKIIPGEQMHSRPNPVLYISHLQI